MVPVREKPRQRTCISCGREVTVGSWSTYRMESGIAFDGLVGCRVVVHSIVKELQWGEVEIENCKGRRLLRDAVYILRCQGSVEHIVSLPGNSHLSRINSNAWWQRLLVQCEMHAYRCLLVDAAWIFAWNVCYKETRG